MIAFRQKSVWMDVWAALGRVIISTFGLWILLLFLDHWIAPPLFWRRGEGIHCVHFFLIVTLAVSFFFFRLPVLLKYQSMLRSAKVTLEWEIIEG